MKQVRYVIIGVVAIGLIVGYYFYLSHRDTSVTATDEQLSAVQQIVTKDIEKNYPKTPREVVKAYCEIQTCYYGEKYSDKEFEQLVDRARYLMDEELLENNPRDEFVARLKTEIEEYKKADKTITSVTLDHSNDVEAKEIDGRECATLQVSYFIKEKGKYSRTHQKYLLRKDEEGKWKILAYYLAKGDS